MASNPDGIRSHPEDRGDLTRLDVEAAEDRNHVARVRPMFKLAESEGDEDVQSSPQLISLFGRHVYIPLE